VDARASADSSRYRFLQHQQAELEAEQHEEAVLQAAEERRAEILIDHPEYGDPIAVLDKLREQADCIQHLQREIQQLQNESKADKLRQLKLVASQCADQAAKRNPVMVALPILLSNPVLLKVWTGLDRTTVDQLLVVCQRLRLSDHWGRCGVGFQTPFETMLTMLLIRLRKGLPTADCAILVGLLPKTSVYSSFRRFAVQFAAAVRQVDFGATWTAAVVDAAKAQPFRGWFDDVDLVADCSSTPTVGSGDTFVRDHSFSAYYGGTCAKWAIGMNTVGYIVWWSKLYAGNVSDDDISISDNIADWIRPGGKLLYDKGGGTLRTHLSELGKGYLCPHTKVAGRLTTGEAVTSRIISNRRSHVERAVRRVKHFKFLTSTMHQATYGIADDLFTSCVFLCNLQGPIRIRSTTVVDEPLRTALSSDSEDGELCDSMGIA
jgi:hypothetical protein